MSPRHPQPSRRYPRTARVGELLREVLAEELERIADADERVGILTVTAVLPDPDLRQAKVLLSSMSEEAAAVLEEHRLRLQAAIGRQVRMKRTPQLRFLVDPAVESGQRIEDILRTITTEDPEQLE